MSCFRIAGWVRGTAQAGVGADGIDDGARSTEELSDQLCLRGDIDAQIASGAFGVLPLERRVALAGHGVGAQEVA